jgi:tetratricopeptide (TPR) repeat protein
MILKSCLESFSNQRTSIGSYTSSYWFPHLQNAHCRKGRRDFNAEFLRPRADIIRLLYAVLNDEEQVSQWCTKTKWAVIRPEHAKIISECLDAWMDHSVFNEGDPVALWVAECIKQPASVFVPAAKMSAKEALRGDKFALDTVARVKAMIEGTEWPGYNWCDLPADKIMEAATWFDFEHDAEWHRKLARCLRCSGHFELSIKHYSKALESGNDILKAEARNGLAAVYKTKGDLKQGLGIAFENVTILENQLKESKMQIDTARDQKLRAELRVSHNSIGHLYRQLGDTTLALIHFREAMDYGMAGGSIQTYFEMLAESDDPRRFDMAIESLELLHCHKNPGREHNNLDTFMREGWWPTPKITQNWFTFMAKAAQQTDHLPWLIEACQTALAHDAAAVNRLKLCLIFLYRDFAHDFVVAEPYIQELGTIASCPYEFSTTGLDWKQHGQRRRFRNSKSGFANSYCQIQLRDAIAALAAGQDAAQYVENVRMLHASGIDPLEIDEKLLDPGRDASHLYLAALQLRTGDKEAALATLLPYIKRCFAFITQDNDDGAKTHAGQVGLVLILLALGRVEDALGLYSAAYRDRDGSLCEKGIGRNHEACRDRGRLPESFYLCKVCFESVCEGCDEMRRKRGFCCKEGHDLVYVKLEGSKDGTGIVWRDKERDVDEVVKELAEELGVEMEEVVKHDDVNGADE